jgi:hypothetical protein
MDAALGYEQTMVAIQMLYDFLTDTWRFVGIQDFSLAHTTEIPVVVTTYGPPGNLPTVLERRVF